MHLRIAIVRIAYAVVIVAGASSAHSVASANATVMVGDGTAECRLISGTGQENAAGTGLATATESCPTAPLLDCQAWQAASVAAVTTLVDNGPSNNRIDIVLLGDGYTSSELGAYHAHAAALLDKMFNPASPEPNQPFAAYAGYFNVHRVDVVSAASGIDNVPGSDTPCVETALDMGFRPQAGVSIYIDIGKTACAGSAAPAMDLTIALANITQYGAGIFSASNLVTVSGNHSYAGQATLHELGHCLGGLADEYFAAGTHYTGPEPREPNVSIYPAPLLLANQAKWFRWLDVAGVGSFEGAYYREFGIYRPTADSLMRTYFVPFGPVNSEQLVINFYCHRYSDPTSRRRLVRPIDDATPSSPMPLPADTTFFVRPVQPTDHSLDVQWFLDGTEVPAATGSEFVPPAECMDQGVHQVSVEVVDNTPWVRDEDARRDWMTETRQWQVEAVADCNGNRIPDSDDIAAGSSRDVNGNGVPDECEADCDANGVRDLCDIAAGRAFDCNHNRVPDSCDIRAGTSDDFDGNGVPDECDPDCNENGIADHREIALGMSADCDGNGVPDGCDIGTGVLPDCNSNGVPDVCDVRDGTSADWNGNGVPDECDDCNGNQVPDRNDIASGVSRDCNGNHVPDECDIGSGASTDVNGNGVPDSCECQRPAQDTDGDGDVDLTDFASFMVCFNGPNRGRPPRAEPLRCVCLDSDGDRDVDLIDFAEFQRCFNGPDRPTHCGT